MSQVPIRAVIFDLGNVLVFHDNALLFRAMAAMSDANADALARSFDGALWEGINRGELQGDAIRDAVCARLGRPLSSEEFFSLWNCHFRLNNEVFPHVESLVGRVKLLLLSNTNDLHARYLLPRLPLLRKFDHVLLSHELGLIKPQPQFFHEALRRAQTLPQETAFFDDLPEFVEAARALGIRAQRFDRTEDFPEQLRSLGL